MRSEANGVKPSMGEIFVARGKVTKERHPGFRSKAEIRPRNNVEKSNFLFSDEMENNFIRRLI